MQKRELSKCPAYRLAGSSACQVQPAGLATPVNRSLPSRSLYLIFSSLSFSTFLCAIKCKIEREGERGGRRQNINTTIYYNPSIFPSLPSLTSFVFQRCRCDGKLSALGRLSKLSGSLIGSPSVKKRKKRKCK